MRLLNGLILTTSPEAIVTQDISRAEQFKMMLTAAAVYMLMPQHFTDGFVFGLGANQRSLKCTPVVQRRTGGPNVNKFYINGQGQIRE